MNLRDRTAIGRFRILVVANETIEGEALHEVILGHAGGHAAEVVLIAPISQGVARFWSSHDDDARDAAELRLVRTLERLELDGVPAYGWVADAEPLEAMAEALAIFEADELIIATHPEWRSFWLARDLIERARDRFDLPVAHVVVYGARSELINSG